MCDHCKKQQQQQRGKENAATCGNSKCPAQVLYLGANFQPHRSDEDIFYDCQSIGDNESLKCCNKYDDAAAVCDTVQRAALAAHMIMKNLDQDKCGCRKACTATLEITARLITDPKNTNPNCRLQGRPVTVQMPLEFDPKTGHLSSKSGRSICEEPAQSGNIENVFEGSYLGVNEEKTDEPIGDAETPPMPRTRSVSLLLPPDYEDKRKIPEKQVNAELDDVELDELETSQETEIRSKEFTPILMDIKPPEKKRYYQALPQHKDFSNCAPCRFSPSPIMDEEGNVFCPGNCGCCQCAWKVRSFDKNDEHVNVKVCRCVQRGTIFTNFDERENCSQTSYFDFCPCREKAEAKFLQLYSCEMWSTPDATRGPEITLDEIEEITDFESKRD